MLPGRDDRFPATVTGRHWLAQKTFEIRDAMGIIDRRFPDARVFTEIFF